MGFYSDGAVPAYVGWSCANEEVERGFYVYVQEGWKILVYVLAQVVDVSSLEVPVGLVLLP